MSIEHWDNPTLNKKMVDLVQQTTKKLEQLYQGKAKSFANVLNDMNQLEKQFKEKLVFDEQYVEEKIAVEEKPATGGALENVSMEKVYVRLFHREMENLTVAKASKGWIKPLLESVLSSEKLGLAVYSEEDNVKKSLRSDLYGYATLLIAPEKDITAQRPAKMDDKINCPLLTLSDICLEDIIQFSYQGKDYPIIKGVMKIKPQDNDSEG